MRASTNAASKLPAPNAGNELLWRQLLQLEFNSDGAKLTLDRQAYSLVRLIPQNEAPSWRTSFPRVTRAG